MKTMTLGLLVALLAAPLMAGEKEDANTKAFLDGATAIKDGALGKDELHLVMLGISIGKMTLEVTKGEVDGKPVYLVTANALFEMGMKNEMSMKAMLTPALQLISQEETESEDGKVVKTETFTLKDGVVTVEKTNSKAKTDADKSAKYEVKAAPTLMLGAAGMLLGRVLPAEAKNYAFKTWDSDSNEVYDALVEVTLDKDVVTVKQTNKEAEKDDEGNITTSEKATTGWLKAGRIIKLEMGDKFVLTADAPAKRTPVTDEMLAKQDKEFHPAALFFKAVSERSEEKIALAVNIDRFLDFAFEKDPEAAKMSAEEKAAAKAMYGPMMAKQLLGEEKEKSEADKKNEAAFSKLLMHVENFVVEKGEGDQMKVSFTKEVQDAMKVSLTFIVEKIGDKWQAVWIDSKSLDEEEGK